MHEGGIATPLIAHWPSGIAQPGRITDAVGHVIDLMATVGEAASVTYPDSLHGQPLIPLQGKSLLPVFAQPTATDEERTLFWEHIGNRAVRQGTWKLAYDRRAGAWELYDLKADPTELNDLAAEQPERVRQMQARWESWAEEVGVSVNDP